VISGARIAREIAFRARRCGGWWDGSVNWREGEGRPATGYFLEQVPDILMPDMLKQRLKGASSASASIIFFRQIDNRVALELGSCGRTGRSGGVAEEQTAGRGRAGARGFRIGRAGIYVTLLLRPKLAPVQAPLLTMMAGLSARTAIEAVTG